MFDEASSALSARRPRVLIVSNRLPITIGVDSGTPVLRNSHGGLATGLQGVHDESGGLWIGWPGNLLGCDEPQRASIVAELMARRTVPVFLSDDEIRVFYEEISNNVLWPICHDRIDHLPLRVEGWDTYEAVNERFAETVVAHWRPGDLIWIHDYHLLRVPALVRRRLPTARIGFFLHVPFPNPEVFFTLSVRRWLIEGMLGADLIGFHTRRYRGHFTGALRRLFHVEMNSSGLVEHTGGTTKLGIFPMGIDADDFATRAASDAVAIKTAALKHRSLRLLVGVDRLDYSKGIPRRLVAIERLLQRHPFWRERVRFIQVAIPSRGRVNAYQQIRRQVEGLVGRINGEFATPDWTPIHYLYRSVPSETLLALYRAADVMLVTPLRDGMNLVAKEFVASRADNGGMLVLSEFAGAADELADAIIVNPYDVDGVADAIHYALTMSDGERRACMSRMRDHVRTHALGAWTESFINDLADAHAHEDRQALRNS